MMTEPDHDLTLGGVALMAGGQPVPYPAGFTLSVVGDDATFGDPQPVTTTLYSMLRAGSVIGRDADQNRQPAFVVEIESDNEDGNALALGEKLLLSVCNRPAELVWKPPQPGALPIVFDIVDSSVTAIFDDNDEMNGIRAYRITMSALPYGRAPEVVSIESVAQVTEVRTSVSDPSTDYASWGQLLSGNNLASYDFSIAASHSGGVVIDPSAYNATGSEGGAGLYLTGLLRTGLTADFSTTPFLVIDYLVESAGGLGQQTAAFVVSTSGGRVSAPKVMEITVPDLFGPGIAGNRAYFRVPVATVTEVGLLHSVYYTGSPSGPTGYSVLAVNRLWRSPGLPAFGSKRQQARAFEVGGTMPTQGTIRVASATGALGDTLIYSAPTHLAGVQPPLSSWYASVLSRTDDPSLVSGKKAELDTDITPTFVVPVSAVPEGETMLMARLRHHGPSSGGTDLRIPFDVTVCSQMGGVDVGVPETRTVWWTFSGVDAWVNVPLSFVTLPPTRVGPTGGVRITVRKGGGSAYGLQRIEWDEMWLFSSRGRLTQVNGVTQKHLEVAAPSLDDETGRIVVYNTPTDYYSVTASTQSRQRHDLDPGDNNVFVVTAGQTDALVSAELYLRYHANRYTEET